jgi:hypothetical protein
MPLVSLQLPLQLTIRAIHTNSTAKSTDQVYGKSNLPVLNNVLKDSDCTPPSLTILFLLCLMLSKQRESSDKMEDEIDLGDRDFKDTNGLLAQDHESHEKFSGNENQASNLAGLPSDRLKRIVLSLGVVFFALMSFASFIALARRDPPATSAHRSKPCQYPP